MVTYKINWYDLKHNNEGQMAHLGARLAVSQYVTDGADVRAYLVDSSDGNPLSIVAVHDRDGNASMVYEFTEE